VTIICPEGPFSPELRKLGARHRHIALSRYQ
jgi:hypothetical protein